MAPLGVGLYGGNGHQIQHALVGQPRAELAAFAALGREALPEALRDRPSVRQVATLDELLADPRVQFVALCSPRRRDQAREAIRCLEAGKHVYAEKPCAMSETELDEILATARRTGRFFREMSGAAFEQPYLALRQVVRSGVLGTVVQALAQKSYPYHERRPQDEDVDGGLLLQVGVHAFRFIEQVGGVRIAGAAALETQLGNPGGGGLRMAVSMSLRLENGGVASVLCNYLNPPTFGSWGNEALRVFGTQGMVEAVDGGKRTRLVLNGADRGPLDVSEAGVDWLGLYLAEIQGEGRLPVPLEEDLHPTRLLLRARDAARRRST
jgi:predicted dehydrogenase